MKIGGLMKLTLLDYPEKVACTVFTVGCNLKCPFCHNATLVQNRDCQDFSEEEILAFLKKRKNVLEGMCLTGGEPLIHDVAPFLKKVKDLDYLVKLDTNGFFPDKLQALVQNGLVDYVAMDIKNSLDCYSQTVGKQVDTTAVKKSVAYLKSNVVPYEFRTTVTGNYHNEESILAMGKWLKSDSKMFLQKFVDSGDLLDNTTFGVDDETMERYREILLPYLPNTQLRGIK